MAALRAQSIRAVRGAADSGARPSVALRAVRRHAGFGAAHRGGAWRRPGRVRSGDERRRAHAAAPGDIEVRGQSGAPEMGSADGRVTSVMPNADRVFRPVQHSWRPKEWSEDGGWTRLFRNAR